METSREIEATEFDWFATDKNGHFAIFATAGRGPVPESVLAVAKAHDAIGDALAVVGWGTDAVWQSYSWAGLYAYDWSDKQGCYVRIAEPAVPLPTELEVGLASCPGLLRLEALFSQVAAIRLDRQDGTYNSFKADGFAAA
ncbi:hypothetical protein [Dyella subtropica]|uniref:hypothetical protein n=1 Tax=Dyella subtropica TaxID=2992127 RepID=UPI0022590830|nr:hypothetical protein [Dyella subtropica]